MMMNAPRTPTAPMVVEAELQDLRERLDKLRAFRDTGQISKISPISQSLLYAQINAMANYAAVLVARLENWGK